MKYIIHTDGGSRGNPGPAAIGVVIEIETRDKGPASSTGRHETGNTESQTIASFGKVIGVTTNNVAEYTAVVEALKWMIQETRDKRQEKSDMRQGTGDRGQETGDKRQETSDMKQGTGDKKQGIVNGASVEFFLDSVLVVNQLNGLFKVKDEKMRTLMFTVRQLEQESGMHITYTAVRREFNSAADAEVNKALDGK